MRDPEVYTAREASHSGANSLHYNQRWLAQYGTILELCSDRLWLPHPGRVQVISGVFGAGRPHQITGILLAPANYAPQTGELKSVET